MRQTSTVPWHPPLSSWKMHDGNRTTRHSKHASAVHVSDGPGEPGRIRGSAIIAPGCPKSHIAKSHAGLGVIGFAQNVQFFVLIPSTGRLKVFREEAYAPCRRPRRSGASSAFVLRVLRRTQRISTFSSLRPHRARSRTTCTPSAACCCRRDARPVERRARRQRCSSDPRQSARGTPTTA